MLKVPTYLLLVSIVRKLNFNCDNKICKAMNSPQFHFKFALFYLTFLLFGACRASPVLSDQILNGIKKINDSMGAVQDTIINPAIKVVQKTLHFFPNHVGKPLRNVVRATATFVYNNYGLPISQLIKSVISLIRDQFKTAESDVDSPLNSVNDYDGGYDDYGDYGGYGDPDGGGGLPFVLDIDVNNENNNDAENKNANKNDDKNKNKVDNENKVSANVSNSVTHKS